MDDQQQEDLRRLRWACRRGMLELDLLFERYVNTEYLTAPESEQETFKNLLSEQDQTLFDWLVKREPCPNLQFVDLIRKLIGK